MAAAARMSNLAKYVKEIRIHLCQRSPSSQGVRDFLERNYINIKKQNPRTPILVRECSGVMPKMYARYDFGQEGSVALTDKNSEEVLKALEELVAKGPEGN